VLAEFLAFEATAVKKSTRLVIAQLQILNLMSTQEMASRAAFVCRDAPIAALSSQCRTLDGELTTLGEDGMSGAQVALQQAGGKLRRREAGEDRDLGGRWLMPRSPRMTAPVKMRRLDIGGLGFDRQLCGRRPRGAR
jgi:hypothetical protein